MTIKWNLQRPTLKNIYIYLYSCVVKYHVCGGFLPQFFTTSSVIYAPHTFSLSSLYSCENIFSVKHLLEECGDIAYLLPVSKAAEWNPPHNTHTPSYPLLFWLRPTVYSQTSAASYLFNYHLQYCSLVSTSLTPVFLT